MAAHNSPAHQGHHHPEAEGHDDQHESPIRTPKQLITVIVLSFVVQLVRGHSEGFLRRVAASALGAFVIVGLIGLGLGLASLFA